MKTYALTADAESDLAQIVNFIADRSPQNALKVFDRIHSAARRLADFPGIGHQRADLADETLRVWSVYSFLIIYRPKTRPLEIVRILHGARDIGAIMGTGD